VNGGLTAQCRRIFNSAWLLFVFCLLVMPAIKIMFGCEACSERALRWPESVCHQVTAVGREEGESLPYLIFKGGNLTLGTQFFYFLFFNFFYFKYFIPYQNSYVCNWEHAHTPKKTENKRPKKKIEPLQPPRAGYL